jgi:chemotaxis protein methyltransferase CheR
MNQEFSTENAEKIQKKLYDSSRIQIDPSKIYLLRSRLRPLLKKHGFETYDQLVEKSLNPSGRILFQEIVEEMTTNETFFFRDQIPFNLFKHVILPQWQQESRSAGRKHRTVWSAACSSGQELYSLAMTILDVFHGDPPFKIDLIGTDLARTMVEKAQSGIFTKYECSRGLTLNQIKTCFEPCPEGFKLRRNIIEMCRFQPLNLFDRWNQLPLFDLIFCRNVAIYFPRKDQHRLFMNLRKQLKPDGFLVLGCMENMTGVPDLFNTLRYQGYSYYQPC